ncbi:MAG: serine/threonine protein kinase [Deltaproteobacteria bacterium]|nr:serine/threonine protein kinase [Deltaproteobacteria bacterium]
MSGISKFALGGRLGEGRVGEVFEAENRETRDRVAVKLLRLEPSKLHEIQGFYNDVRTIRPITNAGIAKVFDVGQFDDGRAYVITELLTGESLAQRLQRGRFSTTQTADVVQQVARALMAVSGVGVVHHALKPSNLWFVPDPDRASKERVVVVDFGLAKLVAAKLEYGAPQYLAPEQWTGAPAGSSVDVYQLGLLAFEMMCGRQAIKADTHVLAREKHLKEVPPSVRSLVPDAGATVDRLIARMLEKNPTDRPKSLRDLAKLFDLLVGLEAPLGETVHDE